MTIKHPFRWLHTVVAVIGVAVCGMLVGAQSGHPPGVMFLPYAVAAWLTLHLFVGFANVIAARGLRRLHKLGKEFEGWPIALVLILFACGAFFLYQLLGIVYWFTSNEAWGPRRVDLPLFAPIAFACFCGILLRRNWGRLLTAAASCVIALFFTTNVIKYMVSGRNLDVALIVHGFALISGFALLSFYLLRSPRIRSFFP